MTDRDYEKFFDLLKKIVHGPGTWNEKKIYVQSAAVDNDAKGAVEEFVNWFEEEYY